MRAGMRCAIPLPFILLTTLIPTVTQGQICGSWTGTNLAPSSWNLTDSASGNGRTVMTGSGRVVTSPDGSTWHETQVPGINLEAIVWDRYGFIAVGSSIITSEDGSRWSVVEVSPEITLEDVTSNGSTRVAVGFDHRALSSSYGRSIAMISTDRVHWVRHDLPQCPMLSGIVWDGRQFVAVGRGIWTSADGVNWVQRLSYAALRDSVLVKVSSSPTQVVAVGGSQVVSSSDGIDWTIRPLNEQHNPHVTDIACDLTECVAATTHGMYTSHNAIEWIRTTTKTIQRVAFSGDQFYALDKDGLIQKSTNGTDWKPLETLTNKVLNSVTHGLDLWVAVGQRVTSTRGVIYTSRNGQDWTELPVSTAAPLRRVIWDGTQFVAVGDKGGVYSSSDGLSSSQHPSQDLQEVDLYGITKGNLGYVAVGGTVNAAIFVSPDGISWRRVYAQESMRLSSVIWDGHQYLAVGGVTSVYYGSNMSILTSPDGMHWTSQTNPDIESHLNDVVWSGDRFVAVGDRSAPHMWADGVSIVTSVNGKDWQTATPPPAPWSWNNSSLKSVTWTGKRFIAVGTAILTSRDGLVWTVDVDFPYPSPYLYGVASEQGQVIAVGDNARVQSPDCTGIPPLDQADLFHYVIPTAAHSTGLSNTHWTTNVDIHNPDESDASIDIYFLARGRKNLAAPRHRETVPAKQILALVDVVSALFDENENTGAITISSNRPLLIGSRTANATNDGSYGQYISGFPLAQAITDGQSARLIQLTKTANFRTNIGFVNAGGDPTTVRVDVFRANGEWLGALGFSLPLLGYLQVTDFFSRLQVDGIADGYVIVAPLTPNARFFTYASVVDNHSGDPIYVAAVKESQSVPIYLPGVAHNPGLLSTHWRTDLEIHNPGPLRATYSLELLLSQQDNSIPTSYTYSLDPDKSFRILDVVKSLFGYQDMLGALRVTPITGQVMATARTYNDAAGGTYGQFIPGFPTDQAIPCGAPARVILLAQSVDRAKGFRTNLGFVSLSRDLLGLEIQIFAGNGTYLGGKSMLLKPFEFRQINEVLTTVTSKDIDDAYAVLNCTTPNASFLAYASVVDNRSGDPIYVPARR